ncbi:GNAT family N-acetyltransferase [Bordetella avium]|uniref:Acetyltransferase n=1 Tax=Bordetella avium (strain 197N) TaxID=360910 RepID=Q2KXD6_BORA1|nr:GNAT family protein [Bordetella avium]AZY53204.1 N-acetyltransferase [Bordetella avium]RIQ17542.1 N-acetyltransferase [Bordetella avium]RIQ32200.1 N-acetyltransferase [Bordetella avium]RIQ50835.1 N-acetyltransferase [Bordetella avium]RIQ67821.1 N-acetyltransferase [Bordetella avium]
MRLIPFGPDHFVQLASWLPDQRGAAQWGGSLVRYPLDAPQFENMLAENKGDYPARRCWMAEENGDLVGHGQLAFEWHDGNARLGRIVIAPEARGQGMAKIMLRQLIDHAFSHPEIQRVELNVYTFNTGAISVYRSLGFVWEGVRRSATPSGVGDERWDTGIMAVLRPEWAQQQD